MLNTGGWRGSRASSMGEEVIINTEGTWEKISSRLYGLILSRQLPATAAGISKLFGGDRRTSEIAFGSLRLGTPHVKIARMQMAMRRAAHCQVQLAPYKSLSSVARCLNTTPAMPRCRKCLTLRLLSKRCPTSRPTYRTTSCTTR